MLGDIHPESSPPKHTLASSLFSEWNHLEGRLSQLGSKMLIVLMDGSTHLPASGCILLLLIPAPTHRDSETPRQALPSILHVFKHHQALFPSSAVGAGVEGMQSEGGPEY